MHGSAQERFITCSQNVELQQSGKKLDMCHWLEEATMNPNTLILTSEVEVLLVET